MSTEINLDMKIDRFKLVKKLGNGAFGEVYQGIDPDTNQIVAIKMESTKAKHP